MTHVAKAIFRFQGAMRMKTSKCIAMGMLNLLKAAKASNPNSFDATCPKPTSNRKSNANGGAAALTRVLSEGPFVCTAP